MTTLTFNNTSLSVINQNNKTFFTATDLGNALKYTQPSIAVMKIYNRNADEFTAEMTALIEMPTAGGLQKVRIFSLRGAHLIAMFARTKVAKDFRKWVLDILDKEISQNLQPALPLIDPMKELITREMTTGQWLRIASMWFCFYNCVELLGKLDKPLELLGSSYSPSVYSHAREYKDSLGVMKRFLAPMFEDIEVPEHERHYRKALETLRNYKPTGIGAIAII